MPHGETVTVRVTFLPTMEGEIFSTLIIQTTDGDYPIQIQGIGIQCTLYLEDHTFTVRKTQNKDKKKKKKKIKLMNENDNVNVKSCTRVDFGCVGIGFEERKEIHIYNPTPLSIHVISNFALREEEQKKKKQNLMSIPFQIDNNNSGNNSSVDSIGDRIDRTDSIDSINSVIEIAPKTRYLYSVLYTPKKNNNNHNKNCCCSDCYWYKEADVIDLEFTVLDPSTTSSHNTTKNTTETTKNVKKEEESKKEEKDEKSGKKDKESRSRNKETPFYKYNPLALRSVVLSGTGGTVDLKMTPDEVLDFGTVPCLMPRERFLEVGLVSAQSILNLSGSILTLILLLDLSLSLSLSLFPVITDHQYWHGTVNFWYIRYRQQHAFFQCR